MRIRPRWRKVIHDLWDNRVRTVLVVASIAVGVFAIGVIAGTYVLLSEDLSASYAAVNPANIELLTDSFDRGWLDVIRRISGVAEAEGRRSVSVRVRLRGDEWDTLELVAVSDFAQFNINRLLPQQGVAVPLNQQVILERKTLASLGASLGDALDIELVDGTRRQLPVVGSAQEPTLGYGGILGDLKGFVTFDTLEWLHAPLSLNRLCITLAEQSDDKAYIQQMAMLISDRVEKSGRQVYRTELSKKSEHPLASIINALLGVLSILGVLVVFLSGSLISNTMSALLSQHTRQIGVMKLVGARQGQVVGMYIVLIVTLGAIALLVAVPLGGWGAFALSAFAADIVNFVLRPIPFPPVVPLALALQVAVALLTPLAAGMLPLIQGSRITVQKALSSAGLGESGNGRASWAERMRWISRPLLISIRNTFRRKGRLALTLFTLTLGGAIFIAVFNTRASLNLQVNESVKYFLADVNLDFVQPYRIERVRQEALAVEGVADVEAWTSTGAELVRADGGPPDMISVLAPPLNSRLIDPTLLAGRWLQEGDQNALVINEAFWEDYPLLVPGDTLRLKIAGKEDDWVVVGVFQYTGVSQLIAYTGYEYLAPKLSQGAQALMYRIVTTQHDVEFQRQVGAMLQERFKSLGMRVAQVEAGRAFADSITDVLGILIVILLAMAMLTALVGSIGLAGTMSMNVLERTREIGVMRAIGAHNQIVSGLVIVEGLLIGLISYALGAALSFPITTLLSNVISMSIFKTPARFAFTAQGFVIWLILVIVLSLAASLWPARNATRLTIREVLAYE